MRPKRLFIAAVDGTIPRILKRLVAEGKLPNMKRLMNKGVYADLATTLPPLSPVAWSTFMTGKNPGKHGVTDFFAKIPNSYKLRLCMHKSTKDEDGIRVYKKIRDGKAFWDILTERGYKCIILHLPVTFPPDNMGEGAMISGMGIVDLRDTFGVTTLYSTEKVERAGVEPKLIKKGGNGRMYSEIEGPVGRKIPVYFYPKNGKLIISSNRDYSQGQELKVGEWSNWMTVSFPISDTRNIDGICQFKVLELEDNKLIVARTPVQPSPYAPVTPYTYPAELSGEIANNVGNYKIIDKTEDGLDDETFLEDVYNRLDKKIDVTKYLMRSRKWDVFLTYFHTLDNIQHIMWKYYDPKNPKYDSEKARKYGKAIDKAYIEVDRRLGEILNMLDEDAYVMVVSDHGGTGIIRSFRPNTWLHEQGYIMTVERGEVDFAKGLQYRDAHPNARPIDWSKTKAVYFTYTGIYLNVEGREPQGVIKRGREYFETMEELKEKLLQIKDPVTKETIYKKVLAQKEVYSGPYASQTPDLIPVLKLGYTIQFEDTYGQVLVGVPVFGTFTGNYSGNHAGPYFPEEIAGVFMIKGPGIRKNASISNATIADMAPTILHLIGVEKSPDMDGRVLKEVWGDKIVAEERERG